MSQEASNQLSLTGFSSDELTDTSAKPSQVSTPTAITASPNSSTTPSNTHTDQHLTTVRENLIDELGSLYVSLTDGPEFQSSMFNGNNPDVVNDENNTTSQETQPLEDKKSRPSQECEEPPLPSLDTLGQTK